MTVTTGGRLGRATSLRREPVEASLRVAPIAVRAKPDFSRGAGSLDFMAYSPNAGRRIGLCGDAILAELFVQRMQLGNRFPEWRTPGGPKVNQHELALPVRLLGQPLLHDELERFLAEERFRLEILLGRHYPSDQ